MVTVRIVRTLALALEGVSEVDHFGRPSFRTKKRIFAVVRPDGLYLHLPEERKEFLFEADPKTFVRFMWGKRANVIVNLERIGKPELERLIVEAWETVRPTPKTGRVPVRAGRGAATRKPSPRRRSAR
ncbi:MAG: MmcQ/YjbR family DNA-binding protein [Alphaproteobacteria bacterium]|nr:MmcQ/YjbR family DNA-binding protein [Alphaproteobacteria bacterium]